MVNFGSVLNSINKGETVPCKLCGKETYYTKIEMCSYCWEMEKGISLFIMSDKKKAKEWLLEQLKSLE